MTNTTKMKLRCFINRDYGLSAGLYLAFDDREKRYFVEPVELKEIPEGFEQIDPTIRLSREDMIHLMDELWQCGVRPSREISSTGQLESMQAHLTDMRTLASAALEIKLPGVKNEQ